MDSAERSRRNAVGRLLLGVSMLGLPMTLVAVRWMGGLGRFCALLGYGILFTRACFMIRSGAPLRMKPLTALLLYTELVADGMGCGAGLWAWVFWPLRLRLLSRMHTRQRRGPPNSSRLGRVAWAAAAPMYVLLARQPNLAHLDLLHQYAVDGSLWPPVSKTRAVTAPKTSPPICAM